MPNQMIALGVRGPQLPDLSRVTQQYGNMMNVAAQQRAAQRQAEAFETQQQRTAQEMEFARNAENRSAAAHATKEEVDRYAFLRNLYPSVTTEEGHQAWLAQIDQVAPEAGRLLRQISPNYSEEGRLRVLSTADQMIDRLASSRQSTVGYDQAGNILIIEHGGDAAGQGAFETQRYNLAPNAGTPPTTPPQGRDIGAAFSGMIDTVTPDQAAPIMGNAVRSGSIPASEVDRLRAAAAPAARPQVDQFFRDQGVQITPTSFAPGSAGQPAAQPMSMDAAPQIIQAAVQNGNIGENDLQSLRQMVGAQYEPQLAQWMQQNNIRITPAGEPSMRSAVYRPGVDAAPQMQQVQQTVIGPGGNRYVPAGRASGRDPLTSPSQNPVAAGDVTGSTTAASEGVRVETQPRIRAGEERAVRLERLRGEAPDLRSDTETAVADLTKRIQDVDSFLTNRYRRSIIGAVEGNLPRVAQTGVRADVQALWDNITNNDVIQDIIASRAQTETGGSVVGPVSDADLRLLVRAASRLTQTGEPETQDENMVRLRRELVAARNRVIRRYEDTLRPLGTEARAYNIDVTPVSPLYQGVQNRSTSGSQRRSLDDL